MSESIVDGVLAALIGLRRRFSDQALDAALALVVAVIGVVATYVSRSPAPTRPDAWAYLLVLLEASLVALRSRAPTAVLLAMLVIAVAYLGLGYPRQGANLPLVLGLYSVAVTASRRRSFLLAVLTIGALEAVDAAKPDVQLGAVTTLLWLTAWLCVGWVISSTRSRMTQTRAEELRRSIDAERLRIARELHDVVAHSIATINVQAGAAAHVVDERPEQAAAALRAIKESSKEALRELRGILSVLREVDDVARRSPEPGLQQLDTLVATTTEAGLPVEVVKTGEPRVLPRTLDTAAYRIIQESLTNALRHAGPARAVVSISYEASRIVLEVCDDGGRGITNGHGSSDGIGLGIIGMRERAAAFGGTLDAGPRADGSFRVTAVLPTRTQ